MVLNHFPPRPDFAHSYPTHLPTLISIAPTLVPYLLSPLDITTLITSYPIDLTTLHTQPPYWHKYFTNLVTLIR
jgi:hypothetical protein